MFLGLGLEADPLHRYSPPIDQTRVNSRNRSLSSKFIAVRSSNSTNEGRRVERIRRYSPNSRLNSGIINLSNRSQRSKD